MILSSSTFSFNDALLVTIVALPLLFGIRTVRGGPVREERRALDGVAALGVAFVLSVMALGVAVFRAPAGDAFFLLDRLSAIMLVLVTGISTIVHAFATRYMDAEPRYGRFFGWLGAVTAAVLLVVITNDLVVLALAWLGVSLSLYQLQVHYRKRPSAIVAASLMRTTHVIGDVAIVAACGFLARGSGTLRIDVALSHAAFIAPVVVCTIVALVAIAAFSKSSQIPFHGWLPETMEAPTPVSALMHAGIVNAGGFLLARFSPLVVVAKPVAIVIFFAGALTALWGTSCMLVRSDVKRGLAYSTVGQMGYMTLQCGLGAFPAAILHLVAHGIFKATLFLGSGYAIHDHKRELRAPSGKAALLHSKSWSATLTAILVVPVALAVVVSPLGRSLPPYGWALIAFATLTCLQVAFALIKRGGLRQIVAAAAVVIVALPAYAELVGWFDRFLSPNVAASSLLVPAPVVTAALVVFSLTLILGWGIVRVPPALRDRAYVWLLCERLPRRALAR